MRIALAVVILPLLLVTSSARAEDAAAPPPPSSGTTFIVLGSLGLAAGVGNLASTGFCFADRVATSSRPACVATSLGFGGAFLAAGLPLVVIGAGRQERWLTWAAGARVGLLPGGAVAGWGASW